MRSALECCALRIAIPKIGDADLRKAAQVLDRIDRDRSRWADFNTDFHSILYKPAARPRLQAQSSRCRETSHVTSIEKWKSQIISLNHSASTVSSSRS